MVELWNFADADLVRLPSSKTARSSSLIVSFPNSTRLMSEWLQPRKLKYFASRKNSMKKVIYYFILSFLYIKQKIGDLSASQFSRYCPFCSQFSSIRHFCLTDQENYQAKYFNSLSLSLSHTQIQALRLQQTLWKSRGFGTDTKKSIRINSSSTIVQGHEVLCLFFFFLFLMNTMSIDSKRGLWGYIQSKKKKKKKYI